MPVTHHTKHTLSAALCWCWLLCPAGAASPVSGSARVSVAKVTIDQDSIFAEVEVALQDEPAWQVGELAVA